MATVENSAVEAVLTEGRGRLLRVLGVLFGMAVTIGITVGMGILRTPGEVAQQLPDRWLFLGAWLLGGVYALFGAVSVAELGTMIPRSGGFYVFARRALGEYPGFVVGWSDWLSTCGTIAAVALVIGEYAGLLVPALAGRGLAVASGVTVAFALLQWRGVRWGSRSQELTSLLKTVAFVALIVACFALGGGERAAQEGAVAAPAQAGAVGGAPLSFVGALVLALQGVIYTYDGWYSTVYFGEEVRDTARSVPRAMVGSVLLVIVVYLLFNAALLYVLPVERLAGQKLAAGAAAEAVFGPRGATVIGVVAIVSLLASVNGNTLTAPRVLYAMSAAKASVFRRLVSSCVRPPQRTPRHCKTAKATVTEHETQASRPASAGKSAPAYSARTSATTATVPHVESQSLHPTTKPGYSPSARRAKT